MKYAYYYLNDLGACLALPRPWQTAKRVQQHPCVAARSDQQAGGRPERSRANMNEEGAVRQLRALRTVFSGSVGAIPMPANQVTRLKKLLSSLSCIVT